MLPVLQSSKHFDITKIDVWSMLKFRITDCNSLDGIQNVEQVKEVALFYASEILPCVSEKCSLSKTYNTISELTNIHEEIFAFFLFGYLIKNTDIQLDIPFFQEEHFFEHELPEEIKKIFGFLKTASNAMTKLHDGKRKRKLPRADCKIFEHEYYVPMGNALILVRKLDVSGRSEKKLLQMVIQSQLNKVNNCDKEPLEEQEQMKEDIFSDDIKDQFDCQQVFGV